MAYKHVKALLNVIVNLFFRQIDVVGTPRIPTSGPVIFVANHANQFIDPMMLIVHVNRVVRFLIAAKSLKRFVIGDLARQVEAIGVDRPQDLAKQGSGKLFASEGEDTVVQGDGTLFTKELHEGSKLKVGDMEVTVKSIESDTKCVVSPSVVPFSSASFKIMPKVDQNVVYTQVHEALKAGDCIGIFPEGGSHDQATMLELKPGVAIMALGAMKAGAGDVQICPCGLNYFEPYRFRSRVVVEFGRPISVPEELVEQYKVDKRGAVEQLMHRIEDAMRTLRPGAENYEELQAIITMRALWKPADRKLTPEESVKITRTFALGIRKFKDDERVIQALREVEDYNKALKAVGCVDRDVQMNYVTDTVKLCRAVRALATVIMLLLPTAGLSLVIAPVAYVTWKAAIREKQTALAGSSVKVKALDVVASQKVKVALVMVPIYTLILNCFLVWLSSGGWTTFLFLSLVVTPVTTSFGIRICDFFWEAVAHCHSFMSSGRSRSMLEDRTQLQKKIRTLVEELGPQVVDDFSSKRTFSAEELARDSAIVDSMLARSPSNETLWKLSTSPVSAKCKKNE